jgi:hypothetical protein
MKLAWLSPFVLAAVLLEANPAQAARYFVYLHGRSMWSWPTAARITTANGDPWYHVNPYFDGSARLEDNAARSTINNTIAYYCGYGNECVIICTSAGCARMFLSFSDLKAEQRYPSGILWSEAVASAAGGTEVATIRTRSWAKLMDKWFNVETPYAPIDEDLPPSQMRGYFSFIQNQATAPVYHLAGSRDICVTFRILGIKSKLCGNRFMPGRLGDGLVPVHSAAGYADAGAHANHADGSAKYTFRGYEQVPLFDADHLGIFRPYIENMSIRVAVANGTVCPNVPVVVDPNLPEASIVYDDADGAYTAEWTPLHLLKICGNDMWAGQAPIYATCQGEGGCCNSFSNGTGPGCSCGESLCVLSKVETISYFTGVNCSGLEYANGVNNTYGTHDGAGMVGNSWASVVVRSQRDASGQCRPLVRRVTYRGGCPEYYQSTKTISTARRVYRPGIGSYPSDPAAFGPWNGVVVSSQNNPNSYCP